MTLRRMLIVTWLVMLLSSLALSVVQAQALCSSCQQKQSQLNQNNEDIDRLKFEIDEFTLLKQTWESKRVDLQIELAQHLQVPFEQRDVQWYIKKNEILDGIDECTINILTCAQVINLAESLVFDLELDNLLLETQLDACEICNPD